jgi:hypothetical protein
VWAWIPQSIQYATGWMIQGSHPGTDNSSPPKSTVSYSMSTGVFNWRIKQPGNEPDKLLPSTAEVNGWSYTFAPSICLHGMNRNIFYHCISNVTLLRSTCNSGMSWQVYENKNPLMFCHQSNLLDTTSFHMSIFLVMKSSCQVWGSLSAGYINYCVLRC